MKKLAVLSAAALASVVSLAQSYIDSDDPMVIERGGVVRKPGTGRGKIVIVNALDAIKDSDVQFAVDSFNAMLRYNIEIVRGENVGMPTKDILKGLNASMAIFIVEDPKSEDTLLIAPESRWAKVNVVRLKEDDPTPARLVNRVQKEFSRAFALLCGAANSEREGQTTGAVSKNLDLDRMRPICIPLDCYGKVASYLNGMGFTPFVEATYEAACQRGWAPQPTNDLQRAIWEKIHAPPSKPMKITYDNAAKKPVVK